MESPGCDVGWVHRGAGGRGPGQICRRAEHLREGGVSGAEEQLDQGRQRR